MFGILIFKRGLSFLLHNQSIENEREMTFVEAILRLLLAINIDNLFSVYRLLN